MSKFKLMTVAALLALAAMACSLGGLAQQAADAASDAASNAITGGNAPSVSGELWSDVPRMDGLVSSDVDMPLVSQMLMQSLLNQNTEDGELNMAIFTTSNSIADVQAFYSDERMGQAGWNTSEDVGSCFSGEGEADSGMGMFCLYGKEDGNSHVGLMIMASYDENDNNTAVFFVRFEETATPEP